MPKIPHAYMPMKIAELELALQRARTRQERASAALVPKHKGGEVEEFHAAADALLQAERDLACARSEPYAIKLKFPVRWDLGAPLPHLLQSELRTFLVFIRSNSSAEHVVQTTYNGLPVRYVDPEHEQLALVEFVGCSVAKLGPPNDEVFDGHPLWGKGFEVYGAMTVENSSWIKELEAINSVHRNYKPDRWRELKHYILAFHDTTFECVARDFKIETYETSLSKLLAQVSQRLLELDS